MEKAGSNPRVKSRPKIILQACSICVFGSIKYKINKNLILLVPNFQQLSGTRQLPISDFCALLHLPRVGEGTASAIRRKRVQALGLRISCRLFLFSQSLTRFEKLGLLILVLSSSKPFIPAFLILFSFLFPFPVSLLFPFYRTFSFLFLCRIPA